MARGPRTRTNTTQKTGAGVWNKAQGVQYMGLWCKTRHIDTKLQWGACGPSHVIIIMSQERRNKHNHHRHRMQVICAWKTLGAAAQGCSLGQGLGRVQPQPKRYVLHMGKQLALGSSPNCCWRHKAC